MDITFSQLKISSGTLVFVLNTRVNLDKVFENIILDEHIIGIKYNNKYKGIIKETNTFYNQATINCWFGQNASIKMFINGNCHISGSLSEEKARTIIEYFINICKPIIGISEIKVTVKDDIIYDTDDLEKSLLPRPVSASKSLPNTPVKIYGIDENKEYYIIGCKRKDNFFIKNEKMILYSISGFKMWLLKTDAVCSYKAYNTKGDYLGYVRDIMIKKCKTNAVLQYTHQLSVNENYKSSKVLFYDKRSNLKGERYFDFDINMAKNVNNEDTISIKLKYKCFDTDTITFDVTNININYVFNTGLKINKSNLDKILREKYNIESDFSISTKMANVVTKFSYDKDFKITPIVNDQMYSCKVIFYTTGKVVIHSSTTINIVTQVVNDIKKIMSENINSLIYKNIKDIVNVSKTEAGIEKENIQINIFDIL